MRPKRSLTASMMSLMASSAFIAPASGYSRPLAASTRHPAPALDSDPLSRSLVTLGGRLLSGSAPGAECYAFARALATSSVETTMRKLTVAATQFACGTDSKANVDRAEALVRQAAGKGAQI